MFSKLPPQRDGKIWCPCWKLDFLALRHHEYYRDNENGNDHLDLSPWKHIDSSRILVDIVQSTQDPTIRVFEMRHNGIFAMFAGSDKHARLWWESTVN